MTALRVHPAAEIFPEMSGEEFAGLVADIREHGQRDPIIVHEGAIIDGRNRYRACREIGVGPRTVDWDGVGSVEAFVVSKNIHRRHLNESQRAMIAARLATLRVGNVAAQKSAVAIATPPLSAGEAADLLSVNRGSVQRAKTVLRDGTPEEIKAVEKGEAAVSAVADAIRSGKPEKRRAVVQRGALKDARGRRYPEKPIAEVMERGLDQLENTIETLTDLTARPDASSHHDLGAWVGRLEKARTAISRIINQGRQRSAA